MATLLEGKNPVLNFVAVLRIFLNCRRSMDTYLGYEVNRDDEQFPETFSSIVIPPHILKVVTEVIEGAQRIMSIYPLPATTKGDKSGGVKTTANAPPPFNDVTFAVLVSQLNILKGLCVNLL